ncbi:hypothetical protein [Burkholderia sp. PU8-34]
MTRTIGTGFLVCGYRQESSRRSVNMRTVLTHLAPTRHGRADRVMQCVTGTVMRDSRRMTANRYLDMISPISLNACLSPASSRLTVRVLVCTRNGASCGPAREMPMHPGGAVTSDISVKHSGGSFVSIV